jgi:carbamoyl-phosphate synthase large subunit
MDDLTVLVTGSGAPGIAGTLYSLRHNFDGRRIKTIGTDVKEDVVGTYLCERFYRISRPSFGEYLTQLLRICKREGVDVLLPQNTAELSVLAEHKDEFEDLGTIVAVSSKVSIDIANNKHDLLKKAVEIGVPAPKFHLVDNMNDLIKRAEELGWPERPVVIKPPVSNGMRGLRIIDESLDLRSMFFAEKPSGVYANMDGLGDVLGPAFPELLVTEYLAGDEYTVDALQAERLTAIPRTRDLIKSGITFNGTVEKNVEIIGYSEKLSKKIGLDYAFGFQFKLDEEGQPKLLESNPRIQGTMVLATFAGANVIYGAVKRALNEEVPEFKVSWGTRILRYWGGIGIGEGSLLGAL